MSEHDDNVENEWSDAITEPLEAAHSSGRLAWPRSQPAPPRDRFRSLSRRLLDDLRKPRPVQSRDLVVLVPGLLIGGLLVGLLVAAVAPSLFSALYTRFTGIPPHQSVAHHATTTHPGATPTQPATATPVPSVEGAFLTRDTATQGNWSGVYGQAGSVIIGVSDGGQQLPAGVQVAPTNASPYNWADSTDDPRALQQDTTGATRIAACWYAADTFSVAITIPEGQTYKMAVYVLDWDRLQRAEDLRILNTATGKTLNTQTLTSFVNGVYLVWRVRGQITLQVTNHTGPINAVVSGIFFSPV
ncbi:MAG TPA: hypothetical protein VHR15_14330 [Ktedonobacterales bacterium]|jgi:hypothetical protein|nr:hypothetical protein [Ktedonobacterales bacterium]